MYLDEQDKALLMIIREHYNLSSDAAAVRFAIHQMVAIIRKEKKDK